MWRFALPLLLCTAAAFAAGDAAYEEPRDLSLNAEGVERLTVHVAAGSLRITGVAANDTIVAKALIRIPDADAEEARRIIEEDLTLELVRDGEAARLEAQFKKGLFARQSGSVALDVTVPQRLALDVDDGSGPIEIGGVHGDIGIDDGSGPITLRGSGGNVTIDDGSGALAAEDTGGNLAIDDGSGEITVRRVAGSVRIDDGSGDIIVSGVAGDLDIEEAGSGGVEVSDVGGEIRRGDSPGDR